MKKLFFLCLLSLVIQGCASKKAVRTYDENTTRTISAEPRVGQPAETQK